MYDEDLLARTKDAMDRRLSSSQTRPRGPDIQYNIMIPASKEQVEKILRILERQK